MIKIHHLNCGTLCPAAFRFIPGAGKTLTCHCLLLETHHGLVLVDTGLGLLDVAQKIGRLSSFFLKTVGPILDEKETALRQIEKLGYKKQDLRHIILTHLDTDHAGGLADFPEAQIHLYRREYVAANDGALKTMMRFRAAQWNHEPRWNFYDDAGDDWKGFKCVRKLENLDDEILLIPLTGHTEGHCGIAVKSDNGWLLHAGDSYFHKGEVDVEKPHTPRHIQILEQIVEVNREQRLANVEKLRTLKKENSDVRVFCSHDPDEFKTSTSARR